MESFYKPSGRYLRGKFMIRFLLMTILIPFVILFTGVWVIDADNFFSTILRMSIILFIYSLLFDHFCITGCKVRNTDLAFKSGLFVHFLLILLFYLLLFADAYFLANDWTTLDEVFQNLIKGFIAMFPYFAERDGLVKLLFSIIGYLLFFIVVIFYGSLSMQGTSERPFDENRECFFTSRNIYAPLVESKKELLDKLEDPEYIRAIQNFSQKNKSGEYVEFTLYYDGGRIAYLSASCRKYKFGSKGTKRTPVKWTTLFTYLLIPRALAGELARIVDKK